MEGESAEAIDSGIPEPLYWGAVEVLSFLFLFLSPLFTDSAVSVLWQGLLFWRVVVVGGWLVTAPSSAFAARLRGLSQGLLYGLPFWVSGLLFPLRVGQREMFSQFLLQYLLLVLIVVSLSVLRVAWFASVVTILTAFWFYQLEPGPGQMSSLLLGGLPMLWRGLPGRGARVAYRGAILLWSVGWVLCLLLAALGRGAGLGPLARGLMLWLVLAALATEAVVGARRRRDRRAADREAELSVPGLPEGLSWLYRRALWKASAPWLVMVPVCVWDESLLWTVLLAVPAAHGLLCMISKGYVSSLQLQWWVCGQFVVIWGAVEGRGPHRFAWLVVAIIFALGLWRQSEETLTSEPLLAFCQDQGIVEAALRTELVSPAPQHFARQVTEAVEPSVDIDVTLSAEAPAGFRKRLLERLKSAPTEDDADH